MASRRGVLFAFTAAPRRQLDGGRPRVDRRAARYSSRSWNCFHAAVARGREATRGRDSGGGGSLESCEAERRPNGIGRGGGENGLFLRRGQFYPFMGQRADDDDGGDDVTEICEDYRGGLCLG